MIPHCLLNALYQSPAVDRGDGFTVFLQGEKPLGLWMLESGRLLISRVSGRGRTVVLDILEAGDLVGLAATVGDRPYETSAQTAEPCRLRLLSRGEFMRILHSDAESAAAIACVLAGEIASAHRWIGNTMLLRSSSEKLANLLLSSSRDELARLTHLELADRIGISRECVTRLLQVFKSRGAVAREPGPVIVRSRSILKSLAAA